MRTSSVGFGDFSGQTFHLSGLDRSGNSLSVVIQQSSTSQVRIVESELDLGTVFCPQPTPNSSGFSGSIEASGSLTATENLLLLRAVEIPPNTFGFFFVGTEAVDTIVSNERLCVGGNIGRYSSQIQNSGANSFNEQRISIDVIPGNPGTVPTPGSTFYFQYWHRDVNSFGIPMFQFTEAISLTFQ